MCNDFKLPENKSASSVFNLHHNNFDFYYSKIFSFTFSLIFQFLFRTFIDDYFEYFCNRFKMNEWNTFQQL